MVLRARCAECEHDFLGAFSCKGRGLCPSCDTRRMVEVAVHLACLPRLRRRQVEHVFPRPAMRDATVGALGAETAAVLHAAQVASGTAPSGSRTADRRQAQCDPARPDIPSAWVLSLLLVVLLMIALCARARP